MDVRKGEVGGFENEVRRELCSILLLPFVPILTFCSLKKSSLQPSLNSLTTPCQLHCSHREQRESNRNRLLTSGAKKGRYTRLTTLLTSISAVSKGD